MNRADFYVGFGKNAEWLGSLVKYGDVWNIPLEILIQVNQTYYEELVLEFIRSVNGFVKDDGHEWPHEWPDSYLTDYVYIFDKNHEQVLMYQSDCEYLLNPIMIMQGHSLIDSFTLLETPRFPIIKEGELLHG